MSKVRIGVIGVGGMGGSHCENAHTLPNTEMAAACDISQEHLDKCTEKYGCEGFTDYNEMLDSGLVDAIAIAVPHFFHGPPAIAALKKKIHVLVAKPVAVHVEDVDEMLAAHTDKSVVFAAMFNQRTGPVYQEARRLVQSGEIGELQRTNLIITDWFRTQAYYNSGGWRGTWKGEGGGVLLNQCPHNLDLLQCFR